MSISIGRLARLFVLKKLTKLIAAENATKNHCLTKAYVSSGSNSNSFIVSIVVVIVTVLMPWGNNGSLTHHLASEGNFWNPARLVCDGNEYPLST